MVEHFLMELFCYHDGVVKQRKTHYETYTHQIWGAPQFHDLCLDTSQLSITECAQLIAVKFEAL